MAYVAPGLGSRQVVVQGFHAMRGRRTFAIGCWLRHGSPGAGDVSYWRQDGVLTPLQSSGGDLRMPYWNSSGTLVNPSSSGYGATALSTAPWQFCYAAFSAADIWFLRYVPGEGVIREFSRGGVGPTPLFSPAAANVKAMVIGATETGTEAMPAGAAIAECMILRAPIPRAAVLRLAHDPSAFAREMLLYMPLRDWTGFTEHVGGRRYPLRGNSALTAAYFDPGTHPPVEHWRPTRRVYAAASSPYTSATLGVRARHL